MKYERRSAVIEAVQINKLADADTVIRDCPHIVGVTDVWTFVGEDIDTWYIRFEGIDDDDYRVSFLDYIVWNEDDVKVVSKEKFEKKYQLSWRSNITVATNPNTIYTTSTTNTYGTLRDRPY